MTTVGYSAPALKCRARDSWVGWDFRYQYGRLHLVSNNSRLLILPGHHYRNLGSRFLGLCARRIVGDWPARFGHPLLLLETFVDPARFQGTVYRAANWQAVGHSRGFRRGGAGYCELSTPKRVFLYPVPCPFKRIRASNPGAGAGPTLGTGCADHLRSELRAIYVHPDVRIRRRLGSIRRTRKLGGPSHSTARIAEVTATSRRSCRGASRASRRRLYE